MYKMLLYFININTKDEEVMVDEAVMGDGVATSLGDAAAVEKADVEDAGDDGCGDDRGDGGDDALPVKDLK